MGELELKLSLVLNKSKINQKETVPLDTIKSQESKISSHSEMTNNDDSTVPNCTKCGIPMVVRKAVRGSNAGKTFYGCTNYPQCKEVLE
jgi:ssDNA-binding Zn-finger/Zn-ribbon topoisomerase 1